MVKILLQHVLDQLVFLVKIILKMPLLLRVSSPSPSTPTQLSKNTPVEFLMISSAFQFF